MRKTPLLDNSPARDALAAAASLLAAASVCAPSPALGQQLCTGYGAQAPRDISSHAGANRMPFTLSPPASRMNLCNIHTHTHAEHKGPGFSISAGDGKHGGWKCNESASLSKAELAPPKGEASFKGVKPGDTLEVHWVYTTCDVAPGKTLGSCLSDACANPQLRVEAQVFLVVNDPKALDFADFAYAGNVVDGRHQAKALPTGTGAPVVYAGSTTGPRHTNIKCSPLQATWSVRPSCAKIDVHSLHRWAANGNVFKEDYSHGVRQLVTAPQLLAPID